MPAENRQRVIDRLRIHGVSEDEIQPLVDVGDEGFDDKVRELYGPEDIEHLYEAAGLSAEESAREQAHEEATEAEEEAADALGEVDKETAGAPDVLVSKPKKVAKGK